MDLIPSSTLSDVDKFVDSQMRAVTLNEITESMLGEGTRTYVPKFTVDGYGKWREVNGGRDTDNGSKPCLRETSMLDVYKRLLNSKEGGVMSPSSRYNSNCSSPSTPQKDMKNDSYSSMYGERPHTNTSTYGERPRTKASDQNYKHLSTSLRSNIFPGVGEDNWESSTKTAYYDKPLPLSWKQPTAHFAITKDAYMDWAEHDVHRQKLMKAWSKYMADVPKLERQGTKRNSSHIGKNKGRTKSEETG